MLVGQFGLTFLLQFEFYSLLCTVINLSLKKKLKGCNIKIILFGNKLPKSKHPEILRKTAFSKNTCGCWIRGQEIDYIQPHYATTVFWENSKSWTNRRKPTETELQIFENQPFSLRSCDIIFYGNNSFMILPSKNDQWVFS